MLSKTIRLPNYYIYILLLITFSATTMATSAQESDTSGRKTVILKKHDGVKTTSLRIGSAVGYGVYRDMGTAPLRFKGIVLQPNIGLEFCGMRSWTTNIDLFTSVGIFEDAVEPALNFGSFDISNTFRFKMTKRIAHPLEPLSLSAGFGAANFLDVTVNSEYENAATGISDFIGPELFLRATLYLDDFLFKNKYDRPSLQMHTEIGLMPVAAVLRPGYAYIDNYTATQPVLSALFDEYEWNLKPFAGACSDIGFDIIYNYGNRISFSYLWAYHSSGNSGIWRFDHATHLFLIDFVFTFKKKRTGWTEIIEI